MKQRDLDIQMFVVLLVSNVKTTLVSIKDNTVKYIENIDNQLKQVKAQTTLKKSLEQKKVRLEELKQHQMWKVRSSVRVLERIFSWRIFLEDKHLVQPVPDNTRDDNGDYNIKLYGLFNNRWLLQMKCMLRLLYEYIDPAEWKWISEAK